MASSRQTVSLATVAHVTARQHTYTDHRYRELSARLDSIQISLRREAERRETRRARERCAERIMFVMVGVVLALVISRCHSLSNIDVAAIGATPELAREVTELIAKL